VKEARREEWHGAGDSPPRFGVAGWVSARAESIMSMPIAVRFLISLGLVALVAAVDAATGSEISFSVFYLVPVAIAGGLVSRRAGWVVAVLSAATWGYLDVALGSHYSAAWIPLWNAGVRLAFFLLVNELIGRIRTVQAHLSELSRTDTLTGLANARVFADRATQVIAQARRSGRAFTIVYVDLDRFKRVNDEQGHSEGDRVLRTAGALIAEGLRTTDLVARLGGDEFAILMPDTGMDQAGESLRRVAAAITRHAEDQGAVGATFGAVTFIEPPADVDSAVRAADALMYQGKAEGRGRIMQATWPESGTTPDAPGR
jgi:diguanylate cyclase (GGDEF)-like protein